MFVGRKGKKEEEEERIEFGRDERSEIFDFFESSKGCRASKITIVFLPRCIFVHASNICPCFSRDTVRMTKGKMCVKPMEENEEDKVVSMIINYFTARVNICQGGLNKMLISARKSFFSMRSSVQINRRNESILQFFFEKAR